jgi:hypothetical protein
MEYFNVLSRHSAGSTGKDHETTEWEYAKLLAKQLENTSLKSYRYTNMLRQNAWIQEQIYTKFTIKVKIILSPIWSEVHL